MFVFEKANHNFRKPILTLGFILVSMVTLFFDNIDSYAFTPKKEFGSSLFVSFFFNSSLSEWFTNAIYLYMFADNIEDVVGHFYFFLLFLFFGVLANLTYFLFHMNSIVPIVGTSGVISGILGMYFVFFPNVKSTMVFERASFRDVPILISLSIWILIQSYFYIVEFHYHTRSTYAGQVVAFLTGVIIAQFFVRNNFLDRLEQNIRISTFINKTVLCPSCNKPIPAKKYGRIHCSSCNTNFFFDRHGKKFL
ncbi:rhomboid family intramembrane serine protease [Leptospira montravelensis]|uniref:Rhomboid family intramembrane serine protease n=2 Tax=Leptospira TaxID=171 RepID=A0ABY2LQC7_9LEPT|nr:rhomboid family intramembrane serine protease [Leptospira montravelensis]TGK81069.1 rhomboid family intramembrane serine protease [Leptospira montravelensis]TGL01336.1 rhomboid family intramembrane serine protease [Leptospira montravelensis]